MRISDWSSDVCSSDLRRYKRGPFLGYDVKPGHYVEPKVAMRRLTAAEEALIRDHMRSQRGVDSREARDVASDMAGKDAAWPAKIGRASCMERVWPYVSHEVVAVVLKKTKKH